MGMTLRICSIDGCMGETKARGWCRKHYRRFLNHGGPESFSPRYVPAGGGAPKKITTSPARSADPTGAERIQRYTDRGGPDHPVLGTPCWLWTRALSAKGYGSLGGSRSAHRASWELVNGPAVVGQIIDHLCRVRHCVNPEHLEAVTNAENVRRGAAARRALKVSAAEPCQSLDQP